jgi:hypothetical protein
MNERNNYHYVLQKFIIVVSWIQFEICMESKGYQMVLNSIFTTQKKYIRINAVITNK